MVGNMGFVGIALGDQARVHGVHVIGNGSAADPSAGLGISCGEGCSISDSTAESNDIGFLTGGSATILDSIALRNSRVGVYAGQGSVVARSTISGNGSEGIRAGDGSTIIHNSISLNQGHGIAAISGHYGYGNNTLTRNNKSPVPILSYGPQTDEGGVEIGPNLCRTDNSCP
jgi:hypothetical protein